MEFLHAYLLSPGSILVGVVTIAFLVNGAWPRLSRQKTGKIAHLVSENHDDIAVIKEPEVPKGWWDSQDVFELERRALFSKSWVYLAHATQFSKPGSYQSFDIAGFPIFLIKGKDSRIRAFHNVCRHRAYTITRKEAGSSTVLGCRYHGWSYDTYGRLVKAPQFEDVPGFDKSENSLFEIHSHTTEQGSVFVNLEAGEPAPFEEATQTALESFARTASLGLKSEWIAGQTLTGNFNWKLGASSRHFTNMTPDLEKTVSEALPPSLATQLVRAITQKNNRAICSIFPATFLYSFEQADLWLSLTFLPSSEAKTQIRYDIFNSSRTETDGNALANAVGEVMQGLIKSMEIDFKSVTGRPIENSKTIQIIVMQLQEHQKKEKINGGLILPAMRQPKGSSLFQQAEQLCKELDCSGPGSNGAPSGGLDW